MSEEKKMKNRKAKVLCIVLTFFLLESLIFHFRTMFQFKNAVSSNNKKKRQNSQNNVIFKVKQNGLFDNYLKKMFVIPK